MDRQELEGCGFTLIGEYKALPHRLKYLTLVRMDPNSLSNLPESSAVYAWTANDVVVYVGATDKLNTRLLKEHVRRWRPNPAARDPASAYRYTAELRKALCRGETVLVFVTTVEPLAWYGHNVRVEWALEDHLIHYAKPAWNNIKVKRKVKTAAWAGSRPIQVA